MFFLIFSIEIKCIFAIIVLLIRTQNLKKTKLKTVLKYIKAGILSLLFGIAISVFHFKYIGTAYSGYKGINWEKLMEISPRIIILSLIIGIGLFMSYVEDRKDD